MPSVWPLLSFPMPTSSQGFADRTQRIRSDLVDQGRRVQQMLELAFAAVFDRKADVARRVISQDDAVDQTDVAIEQASVALLTEATSSGASIDSRQLREVLTIVKCNNEFERVADIAVDVAELVPSLDRHATAFPDTFRILANSVVGILRDTVTALDRSDPKVAKTVLQSQHAVWAFKAAVLREAEQQVAKGTCSVDFAFHLHEVASMCEMVADHCTNMAEQVIYLTTGAIVRHVETSWIEVGKPTP